MSQSDMRPPCLQAIANVVNNVIEEKISEWQKIQYSMFP